VRGVRPVHVDWTGCPVGPLVVRLDGSARPPGHAEAGGASAVVHRPALLEHAVLDARCLHAVHTAAAQPDEIAERQK